ncbi:MAG: integrase core domain-containing protein [Candidatus Methylomirabilis sp.]|nr:integrase core domain-containing protein [Candidatus Methylomirabilis sp.]
MLADDRGLGPLSDRLTRAARHGRIGDGPRPAPAAAGTSSTTSDRGQPVREPGVPGAVAPTYSIRASMSRTGDCWDNALMESAFGRLKSELVHLTDFATRAQAQAEGLRLH